MRKSLFIVFFQLLVLSCDKELVNSGFPSIVARSVSGNGDAVVFSGEIMRNSDIAVTEMGFIWQADADPLAVPGFKITAESQNKSDFSSEVDVSIKKDQSYLVRAYVICGDKTVYSEKLQYLGETDIPCRLESFEPHENFGGDTVVIRGKGFNKTLKYNEVLFDDSKSRILNGNDSVLTCVVPYSNTTMNRTIKIRVNGLESFFSSKHNTLVPPKPPEPVIISLSESSVKYGKTLTIYGENLNIATEVIINGGAHTMKIKPSSISHDSLSFEVFNHQDPTQLLGFQSFRIGIVTADTTIWSGYVTIRSSWIRLKDLPSNARYKAGCFTLNGKIYIGGGSENGTVFKDFWKLDPETGTWTRKADIPGIPRVYPFGSSNVTHGYMGCGFSADNSSKYQLYDFYKYDPAANTWSQIPDYPDVINNFFFNYSISINGRPYIGLSNTVPYVREIVNDTWVNHESVTDLMDSPANGVLVIANSYYVLAGYRTNGAINKSVWEYNTITETWTKKANFPGSPRHSPVFFSIGKYGYYGCGRSFDTEQYKDMWRYDPEEDSWLRIEDFPGGFRSHTVSASDGKYGYAGLGVLMYPVTYIKDFWKFDAE